VGTVLLHVRCWIYHYYECVKLQFNDNQCIRKMILNGGGLLIYISLFCILLSIFYDMFFLNKYIGCNR